MVMNTAAKTRARFAVSDVEGRNASVRRAMQALLAADLRPDDLRYLLDMTLWRYTEFDKNRYKFAIRYRSSAVLAAEPVEVNHEHVVERRWVLDQILAHRDRLDEILPLVVGCLVSTIEHSRLRSVSGFGWDRYLAAQIDVIDTATMEPCDLCAMAAAQRTIAARIGLDVRQALEDANSKSQ